jgi:hypothetical protein
MFFYGIIASTFILFLIVSKKWDFPQAFATSIFCISIGSFLWESPIIIYNLLTVGFEIDILLYLVCLLYVFFLYTKGIWKTDKNAKLALLLSIIISTIFLIFRSPQPTDRLLLSPYWNSPYFMINRFISTAIVLYCVNTNKHMEKSNKK